MIHSSVKTPRDFIRIWFFWARHSICAAATIFLIVMLYAYTATPYYTSNAKILLLPRTTEGSIITAGPEDQKVSRVSIEDINTEVELIKSDDIYRELAFIMKSDSSNSNNKDNSITIIKNLTQLPKHILSYCLELVGLKHKLSNQEKMIENLRSAITVDSKTLSNLIEVKATTESPAASFKLLTNFLEIYLKKHSNAYSITESDQFFSAQADSIKRQIDTAKTILDQYSRKHEIVNYELQNTKHVEMMTNLDNELKNAEVHIDDTRMRIRLFKEALTLDPNELMITNEMRNIPALAEMEKAMVPLLLQKSEIASKYLPSSREYQDFSNKLEAAYMMRAAQIRNAIQTDSIELQRLMSKALFLKQQIHLITTKTLNMNRSWQHIDDLSKFVDVQTTNYLNYASKAQEAQINKARASLSLSNVKIADSPDTPSYPTSPNRLKLLLLSIAAAIAVAFFLPFILEFFDLRIKNSGDIETVLNLPVICSIPFIDINKITVFQDNSSKNVDIHKQ